MATFEFNDKQVSVKSGKTIKKTIPDVRKQFLESHNITLPEHFVVRSGGWPMPDSIIVDDNLWVITEK